jgi:hypothetical protein
MVPELVLGLVLGLVPELVLGLVLGLVLVQAKKILLLHKLLK